MFQRHNKDLSVFEVYCEYNFPNEVFKYPDYCFNI